MISRAAIEAAARALRERDMAGRITVPWDKIPNGQKKKWIERSEAALSAALAAEGMALGWQDIATAPKDGARVLLYTNDLTPPTIQAQWRQFDSPYENAGEWVDVWNNDPIESNTGAINPTHWQPLPATPATAGKEG